MNRIPNLAPILDVTSYSCKPHEGKNLVTVVFQGEKIEEVLTNKEYNTFLNRYTFCNDFIDGKYDHQI